MDLGISGKRALVCASSKGLGRGCAEALAGEGVNLVLNARGSEALEATAAEIRTKYGVTVDTVAADITTESGRAAVLELAWQDSSSLGLRDHAILQLLANYGLRSGEVGRLQIEDINWREDTLRVQRSKSNATDVLPLMEPVGEAVLRYLRDGRPKADVRAVFLRSRAPYQAMTAGGLYGVVKRRLAVAGIEPVGKRGPHVFRHARAVSLLRASTPRKIIGDVLGHRSPESTAPYLKLATEDLRAIAIDLPGREVRQ